MVGFPVMIVAVGLGMGTVFEMYPALYDILKVVGIGTKNKCCVPKISYDKGSEKNGCIYE